MASNYNKHFLIDYPHEHHIQKGQVFRFFGHEFDNIAFIAEMMDPMYMHKHFAWRTHTNARHEYRFQREGNHTDDLEALLVALRMS